jgi:thiol-disulfide isomerase/thioredoxin
MISRLLTLTLIIVWISGSAHAQTNKYSLDNCARDYYSDSNSATPEQKATALRECIIGKPFPAFSATTITGKKYSDTDLKGKVVIITSWFTTCPPCIAEMPMLNELNKKYKDKEFLLLSFSASNEELIQKFTKDRPITYEIVPNAGGLIRHEMQTSYAYPTNIIVNKKGEIVEFKIGTPTDAQGLDTVKKEFIEIIERELSK